MTLKNKQENKSEQKMSIFRALATKVIEQNSSVQNSSEQNNLAQNSSEQKKNNDGLAFNVGSGKIDKKTKPLSLAKQLKLKRQEDIRNYGISTSRDEIPMEVIDPYFNISIQSYGQNTERSYESIDVSLLCQRFISYRISVLCDPNISNSSETLNGFDINLNNYKKNSYIHDNFIIILKLECNIRGENIVLLHTAYLSNTTVKAYVVSLRDSMVTTISVLGVFYLDQNTDINNLKQHYENLVINMSEYYYDYNRNYNMYRFDYIYNENSNEFELNFLNMFYEWMTISLQNCMVIGCEI